MMEGAMKFGGGSVMVQGCMMWRGWDMPSRLMGGWISTFTHPSWRMNFRPASSTMTRPLKTSYSNMMGTNIRATRPNIGSRTWIQGPHMACSNLQILTLLSICGVISKGGLEGMKGHKEGYWSCGRGQRWSGQDTCFSLSGSD